MKLLDFLKYKGGDSRDFTLRGIALSNDLAIAALPGEPFTEIGLGIKAKSPFKQTMVAGLSNGHCGYVPMPECFGKGGYEILTVPVGGTREDTAPRLIKSSVKLLKKL
jgi:hypothetical protein